MLELETEGRNLLNEKVKEVKKAEAKARQVVEQAKRWREEFFAELKKEKEKLLQQARDEAHREIENYSKKIKAEAEKKIALIEKEEMSKEKELEKKANQNFERAVDEAIKLFLETYGD